MSFSSLSNSCRPSFLPAYCSPSTFSSNRTPGSVLIREDQNQHGFIDTSIDGLFRRQQDADACLESSAAKAREEGMRVCGDPGAEPDWEIYWKIEQHSL